MGNYPHRTILFETPSKHVLMTRRKVMEQKLQRMSDGEDDKKAEMKIEIIEGLKEEVEKDEVEIDREIEELKARWEKRKRERERVGRRWLLRWLR